MILKVGPAKDAFCIFILEIVKIESYHYPPTPPSLALGRLVYFLVAIQWCMLSLMYFIVGQLRKKRFVTLDNVPLAYRTAIKRVGQYNLEGARCTS